jgi:hypothetical protein
MPPDCVAAATNAPPSAEEATVQRRFGALLDVQVTPEFVEV